MKLTIDLDKDGESFYVYKVHYTGTPEAVARLEGEEGAGPWHYSSRGFAVTFVDEINERYPGVVASIQDIQVWL